MEAMTIHDDELRKATRNMISIMIRTFLSRMFLSYINSDYDFLSRKSFLVVLIAGLSVMIYQLIVVKLFTMETKKKNAQNATDNEKTKTNEVRYQ